MKIKDKDVYWVCGILAILLVVVALVIPPAEAQVEIFTDRDIVSLVDLVAELETRVASLEQQVEDLQEVNFGLWYAGVSAMWQISDDIAAQHPHRTGTWPESDKLAEEYMDWTNRYLRWACSHMPEEHKQRLADDDTECPEPNDE